MASELIVPGGAEQLTTDTALAGVLAEQGRRHTPKHPQVFRRRAVLETAVVFPEDHIQDPVQTVLDTPVPPRGAAQFRRAAAATANIVSYLEGLLIPFPFAPKHPDDGSQIHPVLPGAQPLQVVPHQAHVLLVPTVTVPLTDPQVLREAYEIGLEGRLEASVEVGFQEGLVALDLEQIVGLGVADRLRDVL